uniref:Ubiquitin-like domain-containing protein n=1 Tax=Cyclophora tenuis TaxID=216820 RepID=A0A7S1D658_CYCTE|mmetsp:Transcript_22939/g.39018  ORF Transcript_22939/g.39018 Transcript_22939/m.39018 type:complete len:121 (+) Transcript_22939:56-418(+)
MKREKHAHNSSRGSRTAPRCCVVRMEGLCQLEIKTLNGRKILLDDVPLTETIEDLYKRVDEVETTPTEKWKLMVVTPGGSIRTLKWADKAKQICEYGVTESLKYRVEVVLDMGSCHMSRR